MPTIATAPTPPPTPIPILAVVDRPEAAAVGVDVASVGVGVVVTVTVAPPVVVVMKVVGLAVFDVFGADVDDGVTAMDEAVAPWAARLLNWSSVIEMGVLEFAHEVLRSEYVSETEPLASLPKHFAAFVMNLPFESLQRHLFISATVSPSHWLLSEAEYRQGCAALG